MFLVLLLISIIIAVYILKKHTKNLSYILWFLLLYWVINIIAGLLIFNQFDYKFIGLTWIVLACIVFIIAYDITYTKFKVNEPKEVIVGMDTKVSNVFLIVSIVLALIYVNMLIYSYGFNITALFNFNKLVELNRISAEIRYSGKEVKSLYMQALLVFVYTSVMIGGYSFNFQKQKFSKLLCFASLMPILLILLIENTKATLISGVILWFVGFLVGCLEINKKFAKPNYKKLAIFLGIGSGILLLIVFSMLLRIGSFSFYNLKQVFYKFFNYAFGQIPAFDNWFYNNFNNLDYSLGQYTFYGLVNFLGIKTRVMGVYPEKVQMGILNTNVYTANRGIISDFGIVGGLAFYAIMGIVCAIAYKKLIKGSRNHELSTTILYAIIAFIFYSFIISIFTYMSYIVAFFVFFLYLITVNKGSIIINLFRKDTA